jgi:hypothetical protein
MSSRYVARLKEFRRTSQYLDQFIAQNSATLLHSAAHNAQLEVVEGCSPKGRSERAQHGRQYAIARLRQPGHRANRATTVEGRADITLRNSSGETPIDVHCDRSEPKWRSSFAARSAGSAAK